MAKEIELKFLVKDNSYAGMATSASHIRQTYISDSPAATVRVRIRDGQAFLTIKGRNNGAERDEWEYAIPVADAEDMASKLAGGFSIDKTRYVVPFGGYDWEVDVFHGRHDGLVIAEVEMPSADCHPSLPPFVGMEVTGDPRYYNSSIAGRLCQNRHSLYL